MDKVKARKMYELATRLSSVNASELTEQQLSDRNAMIVRLQEEMTKMREGHTVPTATGVRHLSSPGVYGGSARVKDPDTKLDKHFVNRAEKAMGIKWGREKERAPGIDLNNSFTEEIIGQPEFEHTGNAGYGSYGAAEYTATTKHRVGSHAYEVTTEQDGDGDFSYFIYENGKEIFSSIQPSNKNQLGHRISSALLDKHKKATAHLFDSDEDDLAEDGHEDMNGAPASGAVHYNVGKLSKEIGTDPRQLKIAIQRSITGNPTRQDTLTVANAFISILKTGDDQTIQNIANIIKAGNPRKDSAQESTTTKEIKVKKVHEEINTEAYDRLRKVFDFSNYKG